MPAFDTIIRGGTVIDGTRTPRYSGDIGIKDGKVMEIARNGRLNASDAKKVLDAQGWLLPVLLICIPTTMPRLIGIPTAPSGAGTG